MPTIPKLAKQPIQNNNHKYQIWSAMKRVMREYGVFVVAIPALITIHWAWFRLQDNEYFVPRESRLNNPLIQRIDGYIATVKNVFSSKPPSTSSSSE
ncbi:hypothetical protein AVEN_261887-1 [Araneus ventricosus]|uniref:Uncharacterized protein n=1 Tax=Araneus ventricosus TaxID=182803 RepID=A0A4Y2KV42_ARAVE|nr:hypothetical protein AVEN_261887-1 [Araneus ventricosus]